jgi:hypothetical protein
MGKSLNGGIGNRLQYSNGRTLACSSGCRKSPAKPHESDHCTDSGQLQRADHGTAELQGAKASLATPVALRTLIHKSVENPHE